MTVGELITKLLEYPADTPVYVAAEEGPLGTATHVDYYEFHPQGAYVEISP